MDLKKVLGISIATVALGAAGFFYIDAKRE